MTPLALRSCLKILCLLGALCGPVCGFALDREAFSITNYDLNLQVDPEQHRLGVRGKITLRNDTTTPQQVAVLQISSSISWRAIKAGDRRLQFVTQPFASDIDHTDALSEAIVTLPQAITPRGTVDLDIAYEGVIELDATRLTRIGTPEDLAKHSDWDQIAADFTAVRGAGYVAWYPIATDVANLSEEDSLSEVLARWKERERGSTMRLDIALTLSPFGENGSVRAGPEPGLLFNGLQCQVTEGDSRALGATCATQTLRLDAPSLLIAQYRILERPAVEVRFLRSHDSAALNFADSVDQAMPLIKGWFGALRERAKVADLPEADDAPFEAGALLLTPLPSSNSNGAGLSAVHQLTHAAFLSSRPWIEEGLAHFAQALYLEQQKGRQAALDYMDLHRSALVQSEPSSATPQSKDAGGNSLVNTINDELYRSKAMCVWWMLRDMVGDAALKKALAAYRPEQDKDPSYMPRLIAAQAQRDLDWFFDDWVYHDHGLPDFKVESAFSSKTGNNSFLLAVTVANSGGAGAEIPIIVRFPGGEVTKRLVVRAKGKATIRIETPAPAQEVAVNDGSVPERDVTNNSFRVPAADAPASN